MSRVAWERREDLGVGRGLLETAVDFLIRPRAAAAGLSAGQGYSDPLLFALLLGCPAILLNLAGLGAAFYSRLSAAGGDPETLARFGRFLLGGVLGLAALSPLLLALKLFLWASILHLVLVMVGGEQGGFEATFRALCYAVGGGSLLALLPVCGAPLGYAWALVSTGAALAGAHGVAGWRGAVAVTLPLVVVFLCCGGAGAMFFLLVVAAGAAGGG